MTLHRSLRLSLAALFATSCAAATLAPLIRGTAWLLPVAIIMILVTVTGIAMRQLTNAWGMVPVVQLVAVVLTLNVLFTRRESWFGLIPSPRSFQTAKELFANGSRIISDASPPVPSGSAIIFLLTVGIALIALAVDLIAVTLERPAVAGLPLLAVYCVPAAVLPHGLPWGYFLLAAIGFLVLIAVDHADRVQAWGQVLGIRSSANSAKTSSGASTLNRLSSTGPVSGGRVLAVVTLVAAVLIPMVTPGLDEQVLTTGRGDQDGKGRGQINVINPILYVRNNLNTPSNAPVIKYRASVDQPPPLRISSNENFNGQAWSPSIGRLSRKQKVQEGLPNPPGLRQGTPFTEETADISISELTNTTYLPLPYPPRKVDIKGDWLYENTSLNVVGDGESVPGATYRATFLSINPDKQALNTAPSAAPDLITAYTALPSGLSKNITTQAAKIAGKGSNYQKAQRINDWLRVKGGFVYDTNAFADTTEDNGLSGLDAVSEFLKNKRGYCVQFASTMAVMSRSLNIPARVAVGFLPGKQLDDGSWQITLRDAHAWPELYFEGIGWVPFEPTPASRVPTVPSYLQQNAPSAGTQPSTQASSKPTPTPTPSAAGAGRPSASPSAANQTPPKPAEQSAGGSIWAKIPWGWLAAFLLLGLMGLIPMLASRISAARRWSQARSPAEIAEAGWDDLRSRLGDLGVSWLNTWTPLAAQHRLREEFELNPAASEALGRLSDGVSDVWYAPPAQIPNRTREAVRQDSDTVVRAVSPQVSPGDRRRALWLPRSGLAILTGRAGAVAKSTAPTKVKEVRRGESRETVQTGAGLD